MSVSGLKVVVTGKFSRGRKEIEADLADAGADVTGSISGKTQLLVCGADAGSKLAKAQKLGVPVVDEAQMERLLAGSSLDEVLSGEAPKQAAKKKVTEKKVTEKKVTEKKVTEKKVTEKKVAEKKVAEKATAKKATAKKATAKKATAKKATATAASAEAPSSGGSLAGMKVVVTGSFAKPRKEIQAALEALGAEIIGSISGKTQLLVVGQKAGSKLQKAQMAGVPVIDEYGFGCLQKGETLEQVLRYDVIVE